MDRTMIRKTMTAVALMLSLAAQAVEPQVISHNNLDGRTQIITNMVELLTQADASKITGIASNSVLARASKISPDTKMSVTNGLLTIWKGGIIVWQEEDPDKIDGTYPMTTTNHQNQTMQNVNIPSGTAKFIIPVPNFNEDHRKKGGGTLDWCLTITSHSAVVLDFSEFKNRNLAIYSGYQSVTNPLPSSDAVTCFSFNEVTNNVIRMSREELIKILP